MSNPAASPSSSRTASSSTRASDILARENAKQAMVWGLQAGGATVDQIEANAPHVLRAASQLSLQDAEHRRAGHPRRSDLFAEGKFQQAARLRRVLCGGVTGEVQGRVSQLQETRGLKGSPPHSGPAREPHKRRKGSEGPSMPIEQARAIFNERVKSLMLQDQPAVRRLFNRYDPQKRGWIGAAQVQQLCEDLGMCLALDTVHSLVSKTSHNGAGRLSFEDFVHSLLGLPHDFFAINFSSKAFQKVAQPSKPSKPLPPETSPQQLTSAVSTGLRQKLFNLEHLKHGVFKAMPGQSTVDRLGLWEALARLGVCTKEAEFSEVFEHFDYRRNSRINQVELLCGLLSLPYPKALAPPAALLEARKPLSAKGSALLLQIKRRVEEVGMHGSTPGERVRRLWKNYDTDGSGEISYDEIHKMTTEFNIDVEGKSAAAAVLQYSDHSGQGKISYPQFVTQLMGLASSCPAEPDDAGQRPSTPELRTQLAEQIKSKLTSSPHAASRAFRFFTQSSGQPLSYQRFRGGLLKLGLPIPPGQLKQLFRELAPDPQGLVHSSSLHHSVTGTPPPPSSRAPSSRAASSRASRAASAASARAGPVLDLDRLLEGHVPASPARSSHRPMGHVIHAHRVPEEGPGEYKPPRALPKKGKPRPSTACERVVKRPSALGSLEQVMAQSSGRGEYMGAPRTVLGGGVFAKV